MNGKAHDHARAWSLGSLGSLWQHPRRRLCTYCAVVGCLLVVVFLAFSPSGFRALHGFLSRTQLIETTWQCAGPGESNSCLFTNVLYINGDFHIITDNAAGFPSLLTATKWGSPWTPVVVTVAHAAITWPFNGAALVGLRSSTPVKVVHEATTLSHFPWHFNVTYRYDLPWSYYLVYLAAYNSCHVCAQCYSEDPIHFFQSIISEYPQSLTRHAGWAFSLGWSLSDLQLSSQVLSARRALLESGGLRRQLRHCTMYAQHCRAAGLCAGQRVQPS